MVDQERDNPLTEVRLFDVPAGWTVVGRPENLLTGLAEGRTYYVNATVVEGEDASRDRVVAFTLAGLRGLGPDQVWQATTPHASYGPMSRDEFRRRAKESC